MTARPRILMVNKYYPPHLGGIESHVRDLATGLVASGAAEVTVLVVNSTRRRVDEMVDGVRVVRVPRAFEYASTPVSWSFGRELRSLSCEHDLVHFHAPYPYGEFCSLFVGVPVPQVVTYHTDIVRQKTLLALYRPFFDRFLDRSAAIVASSPNMIEHSEFLAPRKARCVHVDFGIPLERFRDDHRKSSRVAELRAALGEDPVVLFVGRLVYYKGVDVLVDALSRMKRADVRLVLIGKGPLEGPLRSQVAELGLTDRVSFVAPCDDRELAAWYAAADVFCLPSVERSEAFGLVQIEAHASGTPVVSTSLTTGVPYANLHGETGLVVSPGDAVALAAALDRLFEDDGLRARLGRRARERAFELFTVERMCSGVMSVYDRVLSCRATVGEM